MVVSFFVNAHSRVANRHIIEKKHCPVQTHPIKTAYLTSIPLLAFFFPRHSERHFKRSILLEHLNSMVIRVRYYDLFVESQREPVRRIELTVRRPQTAE